METDFYKSADTNFLVKSELKLRNEDCFSRCSEFIEYFSKKDEKICFSDLVLILEILENHFLEFEETFKSSGILQHIISAFPYMSTLNEVLISLQIFKIMFTNYTFDIESVIDENFFHSLVSFFSDDPSGLFAIDFPSSYEGKEQIKYEKLLLDIFLTLVKKYPFLQDHIEKTYLYDSFSPYIIRTSDFDIFNSITLWIASILNADEDTFESTKSLIPIFNLLEPYFNENECKALLILANSYCLLGIECCEAFNEVFPIGNIFSLLSREFHFMKEVFILLNTLISKSSKYADIIFTAMDINIIMDTLVYANYIDFDKENPTKYIISFLQYYINDNDNHIKEILEILNNAKIINALMNNSIPYNDKIDRFSLVLILWDNLEFEERASFFDEINSTDFINCIDFLLQTDDFNVSELALDTLLQMHSTFFDNEKRFDYSETIDIIQNLEVDISERSSSQSINENVLFEKCEMILESYQIKHINS